ncbi:MAG TPA: hypothetical protein VGP35_04035 [Terriglobales bacterium]|jgi:hypothetical protein|nr:hypothetical protein [Terriglobales bacterium]
MRRARLFRIFVNLIFVVLCGIGGPDYARAELHWQTEKRVDLRVRLIALAEADPRSSFFSTHETFVAAQQLSEDESRLVKLVYEFLPYQPRLSESDFDYSVVHDVRAVRDPSCDQTLAQITTDQRTRTQVALKYSADSPVLNTSRHHSALPCFSTSAADYTKAIHRPAPPEEQY